MNNLHLLLYTVGRGRGSKNSSGLKYGFPSVLLFLLCKPGPVCPFSPRVVTLFSWSTSVVVFMPSIGFVFV